MNVRPKKEFSMQFDIGKGATLTYSFDPTQVWIASKCDNHYFMQHVNNIWLQLTVTEKLFIKLFESIRD